MKLSSWLAVALTVTGLAHAAPYPGPGPMAYPPAANPALQQAADQTANPAVALRAGVDKLLGFLGSEPAPTAEALAAFLDAEIAPFFDFQYMAKSAGGRLFERMSAEEQAALTAEIKQSFLAKMAEKLSGYSNQQVRFMPLRGQATSRTVQVSAAILNPGRYPARLDFRLYRDGEQWRVYDVAANGQSAIVHYRREIMRQMRERNMQRMQRMQRPMPPINRPVPPVMMGPRPVR